MEPSDDISASSPGSGSGPVKRPSERDLIAAALQHQTPFEVIPGVDEPLPPPDTFPGYDIIREIHRGGQGVVYLAGQRATKRRVAIKVMHNGPFAGSRGRARFEREVQVLGQLNHPNIVRIHDSGVTKDGSFYYIMDYISGKPLSEYVQSKKMSVDETLRLFEKICAGVNAAHLKGVIHRDIKPANIRIDQAGEPIVVDFGLAKIAVPDMIDEGGPTPDVMSITGQFIGSLPWASPEQADGAPSNIDVRTDVYSLGVVLYQLLTGKFPYAVVGNMRDVLEHILRSEPTKPSTVRRQIGDEVETIILKCLQKQRDRRYQTAGELGRDIARFLSGQPVEAKSDSGWYIISKTLNRYRTATAVVVGFVALVTFAAIVFAILYQQKSAAESRAISARDAEQSQRERAEANLATATALSRTLLIEFPDEIDNLRGATRARELLLTHAQSAVKRLNAEAGESPEMLGLLAESHMRVADLRAGLYLASTGSLTEAEAGYNAAAAITAHLAERFPTDPRWIAASGRADYALSGVAIDRLQFDVAAEYAHRAANHALKAEAIAGAHRLASASFSLDATRARIRSADAAYRRAESIKDPAALKVAIGPATEAYRVIQAAVDLQLNTDPRSIDLARMAGVLPDKLARIEVLQGQRIRETYSQSKDPAALAEAFAAFDRSEALAQGAVTRFFDLSTKNPANGILRRDLWLAWHNVATARMESGFTHALNGDLDAKIIAFQSALEAIVKATDIARALASADEANLQAQRDVALNLNKLGNMWRELSDAGEPGERAAALETAASVFAESLALRRQVLLTDPTQQHRRDLGLGAFKLGQLQLKMGHPEAAVGFIEEALAAFQRLHADGAIAADSAELRQTGALLDQAKARASELKP